MPVPSTRSHTSIRSHTMRKVGGSAVSLVIKSMKIAHLDNPSLSALSAWKTPTHPHSLITIRQSLQEDRLQSPKDERRGTATCFSFFRKRRTSSSLHRPSLERHETARRPQKGEPSRNQAPQPPGKEGAQKGFLLARPLEGSGLGEHLIHSYLRAINLFKHQNHFASQEKERRLSFLLQSTKR